MDLQPDMNSEKRKTVFLITKWYPNRYDPQLGVFIQKQVKAISCFADVVVFYAQSFENGSVTKTETVVQREEGITEYLVYYPKSKSLFSPVVNAIRYYKAWKNTMHSITKEGIHPDLIHAYILLRPVILGWYLSKKFRIPYIVSEQWSGYATGRYQHQSWLRKTLSTFFTNRAQGGTVVSEFLKKKMNASGFRNPFVVIPNIIDTEAAASPVKRIWEGTKTKILIVADLVDEIKNIRGVLEVFKDIQSIHKNVELKIVGGGKDEEDLIKYSKQLGLFGNTVFFEGQKNNSEVYDYLKQCDFLVVNSRYETFSLICAEAMSCGKPVIATRCGGPEEFVTEQTGILIPVDDPEKLREAIFNLLSEPGKFQQQLIRNYAEEHFSSKNAASLFKKVYTKAIESFS